MPAALLLAAVAGLLAVSQDPKPKSAEGKGELDGTWMMVSSTFDGRATAAEVVKKRSMVIRDGKLIAVIDGAEKDPLTMTLDPTKKPRQIDLARPNGKGAALGIYSVEGDELKLCYGEPGKDRPTEFASPDGGRVYLLVLKREKPKN